MWESLRNRIIIQNSSELVREQQDMYNVRQLIKHQNKRAGHSGYGENKEGASTLLRNAVMSQLDPPSLLRRSLFCSLPLTITLAPTTTCGHECITITPNARSRRQRHVE